MSKPIGPSFYDELKAAGLLGLPFSWSDDGDILFGDAMTQQQRDAVMAVYQAHDPSAPAKPTVPAVVTMRQARLALLGAGLLAQVNTAVANMPGAEGDAARIEWEYAQEVRRDSPLVAALSVAFGWTAAQLDDLFTEGAKL